MDHPYGMAYDPSSPRRYRPMPPQTPVESTPVEQLKDIAQGFIENDPLVLTDEDVDLLRGLDALFSEPQDDIVYPSLRRELEEELAAGKARRWKL